MQMKNIIITVGNILFYEFQRENIGYKEILFFKHKAVTINRRQMQGFKSNQEGKRRKNF